MTLLSSQTDPRGGSKLGAAAALLALVFAAAFASPAGAETGSSAEEAPVAAAEGAAPAAEATVPATESAAPVEAAPAAPAESAAPVEAVPAESAAPVEVAESAPGPAPVESVQAAATEAAPVEDVAAAVAESATAVPARGPEQVEAAVGSGLRSGSEDVGGAVGSAVERAVDPTVPTAVVEPVARTVGAPAPLDAARTALRDSGVGAVVAEAAAPVREALEALPASGAREDLTSIADRLLAPPAAVAAPDPPGSIASPDASPAQLPIQPAAAERPPAYVASGPPVTPPADPQALGGLPPELPSLQGPAEFLGTADGAASQPGIAAAADLVRVDSVTGSSPAGPPSDLPASPSQAPGVAPGSGGAFFFVPLAALLALLALAASASFRRLGEAPDFRPPTPFVCALERPG